MESGVGEMWGSVLECGEGEGKCGVSGEVLVEMWESVLGCGERCGEMFWSVGEV